MTNRDINSRASLLIFYDYFYPGYKAGGPIQSLINLVVTLQKYYTIAVVTSAFDLQSYTSYHDIEINSWNSVYLPGGSLPVNTWYADKRDLKIKKIKEIIQEVNPEVIYLNGIFSYHFFLLPLITIKKLDYRPKVTICPRGMLQEGALSGKYLKKKFYVNALQFSGLLKKTFWHATNHQEEQDIKKVFGQKQQIIIASNIPRKPLSPIHLPPKQNDKLRLIYLSLIAGKKNLLFTLEIVNKCKDVTLDIYGPIKDSSYWKECEKLISLMPGKVEYKGEVLPANVYEIFNHYDASILLTKGENFGHALYESLSVGRPIITSNFTPWINLEQQKAGWNIDIASVDGGISLLRYLSDMPSNDFDRYCMGAHLVALKYYAHLNSLSEYNKLFSLLPVEAISTGVPLSMADQ